MILSLHVSARRERLRQDHPAEAHLAETGTCRSEPDDSLALFSIRSLFHALSLINARALSLSLASLMSLVLCYKFHFLCVRACYEPELMRVTPPQGSCKLNSHARVAYFTQHHIDQLDLNATPIGFCSRLRGNSSRIILNFCAKNTWIASSPRPLPIKSRTFSFYSVFLSNLIFNTVLICCCFFVISHFCSLRKFLCSFGFKAVEHLSNPISASSLRLFSS